MEKLRVAYWNKDGEASEAIVDAESADDAIAKLDDYGHGASVTSVGPAAEELPEDGDVNEGNEDDLDLHETREKLDTANAGPEGEDK